MRRRRVLLAALALLAAAPAVAQETPDGKRRSIVVLADGVERARLLAEATAEPVPLDIRHERVVRGLRSIHERSRAAAGGAIAAATAAGALVEIDRLWIANVVVAEVDPAWIPILEADPAIAAVVPDRRLTLGSPSPAVVAAGAPADPTDDLVQIRVPEAWAEGARGQGTIVANTDTGVNGEDDTMRDRWRGLFAGSDASWFAPIAKTVFPVDDDRLLSNGHGTATMGVLTGGDASFGVAYEATWVAGDVFEDDEGFVSNSIAILQWLADPDGDPTTTSDVPDVVSNSYGLTDLEPGTNRIRCDPIFNDAIDAVEAAGAIVVWSAGNEGSRGVTSPANRADSPVNAFAVGAVDGLNRPLTSSGRGPSECGGPFATKPEVVAPGLSITTRSRFNEFIQLTGTSFSTPMVAGVFALMRSKNPTITPEAAKAIALETAMDLEAPGDDNVTGRGIVDAAAAVARVERPTQPLARLVGFRPPDEAAKVVPAGIEESLILRPGGLHALAPLLTNHGPAIPASIAVLSSPTPGVTVPANQVPLAGAATGAFFGPTGGQAFTVEIDPDVVPGAPVVLDVAVQGAAIGPFRLMVPAGQPIEGGFATHDRGRVRLSVNNFGGLGYYTGLHDRGFVLRGQGFRFPPQSDNWLFHAGFMAGTGPERLSDGVPYGENTQNASDWSPVFGFPITVDEAAGGQRISVAFDDRRAIDPLHLRVRRESFAFDEAGEDGFVILQYVVTNVGDEPLDGLRLGLFADWDLPGPAGDPGETAGWDPSRRLGFFEGPLAGQPAVGVAWLDEAAGDEISYRILLRDEVLESTAGDPVGQRAPAPAEAPPPFGGEFSDVEKWDALAGGQTDTRVDAGQDLYQVIGVGPRRLEPGAVDTVAVALVAAESRAVLEAAAVAAREAYFVRVLGTDPPPPPSSPDALRLEQNFPNPIRPGERTTIRFAIHEAGAAPGADFDFAVYDVAGRRVRTLVEEGDVFPGEQAISWDGLDASGRPVPAGVYVVRLRAGGQERSIRVLVAP